MAVAARGGQVRGVIMHTGQGSEYTAALVRQACVRLGIRQSMGRPGSALDNAVIESWHSTLESGLRSVEHFATRAARPGSPPGSRTTTSTAGTPRWAFACIPGACPGLMAAAIERCDIAAWAAARSRS